MQVAACSSFSIATSTEGRPIAATETGFLWPVALGELVISRSAAVTSSSSGNAECCSSVTRSSSITLRPAERSSIAQ
jgi:hypothetical protein